MGNRRHIAFAAMLGLVAVAASNSCTLNSQGELTESLDGSSALGGSGGIPTDGPAKDVSKEADVTVEKPPSDALDVKVEDSPKDAGCFPGSKECNKTCVVTALPQWGCAPDTCIPCSLPQATAKCSNEACSIDTCTARFKDCNGKVIDGCETPTDTLENCNLCGSPCAPPHASGDCSDGLTCKIALCNSGFVDCDVNAANGCEILTSGDAKNCGSCGNVCVPPTAGDTMKCDKGVCKVDICNAGTADCDTNPNDCEVNPLTDPNNCGMCGMVCAYPNAAGSCVNGVCQIGACTAPYADCDLNPVNGCEVNIETSPSHCGACSGSCNATHGKNPACNVGKCSLTCDNGWENCNGEQPGNSPLNDGCEVNIGANIAQCGACGKACVSTNGSNPLCALGKCTLTCNAGFFDCNGSAAADTFDGCEIHISGDVFNCGGCGNLCNSDNGVATCINGACGINCNPGYGNCDGDPANGCETQTSSDINHCGTCPTICSAANGTPACNGGVCGIACNPGAGDCDGIASNGCEVNLTTSTTHCGTCNNLCVGTHGTVVCQAGTCTITACQPGWGNCDNNASNGCEDAVQSDPAHCGTCPGGCPTSAGCPAACSTNHTTPTCVGGACQISNCAAGWGNCNNTPGDGCEINLQGDPNNCGSCAKVCSSANGTPSCTTGSCNIVCATGFGNCDANILNGCETATAADPGHCGSCTPCATPPNGTAGCVASLCTVGSCATGYSNCNNTVSDGCEVNLQTDVGNCGSCAKACNGTNGTPSCQTGICTIVCSSGFNDCDGNPDTGCEVNINTDVAHCGACAASSCPSCTSPSVPKCTGGVCGCT
jgi:hypothetical protein